MVREEYPGGCADGGDEVELTGFSLSVLAAAGGVAFLHTLAGSVIATSGLTILFLGL